MTASFVLTLGEYWLWIGALVAVVFLTIGIDRIDEDARGAYIFRVLLVPGVLAIWPLVLMRWFTLETGRDAWRGRHTTERHIHAGCWWVLAIALPLIVLGGLALKQNWPDDFTPVRIGDAQ